jgi:indolepyruvate ferredoxin oxidoreductase
MGRTGKTAADNRAAFLWGRWVAHDPEAVAASLASAAPGAAREGLFDPSAGARATADRLVGDAGLPEDLPGELRDLVARRAAQTVDYQDAARALRLLTLVATVAARDDAAHDYALTRAVAESWYKLLTYKDEYEVARLHLLADHATTAAELGIDGPYRVTYHLHPPTLRRLGMKSKLPLGRPYAVAFRGLRGMRRLRGTPFDLFGLDPDRRTERALLAEYPSLVTTALGDGTSYDDLVALASSAMAIKGYGPIKEASVARWRDHVAALRAAAPVAATVGDES